LVPGKDFLRVAEHPEHGGVLGTHATNSYHYKGRAIDIGAYAHEQPKILKAISQFNQKKGVKPVELLKAGDAGHSDHVHVAYLKGGRVLKPTLATLAEDGRPEFVFDADTTAGLDSMTPNLLEYLNAANTKREIMRILQSYAGYEDGAEQTVIVMNSPQMIPIPIPTGNSGSIGGMSRSSSIDTTYDTQYANA
jgi:hypothetical protein